jgi:hypothetical protein
MGSGGKQHGAPAASHALTRAFFGFFLLFVEVGMDLFKSAFGYRFLGTVDEFAYTNDKLRPTWQRRRGYRLTAEHRHQLCVHLAAHAAISNLGGAFVYMLAVAPAGVRSWTISERKAREIGKMWGICSTSDFYCRHLQWNEDRQMYDADRSGWESELEYLHDQLTRPDNSNPLAAEMIAEYVASGTLTKERCIADHRRVVRAQMCGYLAGHIADGITAGLSADEALRLYDRRDTQYVGGVSDIVIAEGLAGLLPPGEYENAVRNTEEVLRQPDVWKSVKRIAEELAKFGLLEGDDCEADIGKLLPKGPPNWPPAPVQSIETSCTATSAVRRRRA